MTIPVKFDRINTAQQLAEVLIVPVNALYCTDVSPGVDCGIEECGFPALLRNGKNGFSKAVAPRCAIQSILVPNGPQQRGHLLVGHEFMRPLDSS